LVHDNLPCWEQESKSGHVFVSLHVEVANGGTRVAKSEG
jgi:hypothetical protein